MAILSFPAQDICRILSLTQAGRDLLGTESVIEPGLNRARYGGKLSPNASPKNSRCPGSVRF